MGGVFGGGAISWPNGRPSGAALAPLSNEEGTTQRGSKSFNCGQVRILDLGFYSVTRSLESGININRVTDWKLGS